jgi:hypothetical protein
MDARVKSRVAAYGDPAAQPGAAGAGAGAEAGAETGYSASLGNIGMGDEAAAGNGHDDGHSPAEAFKKVGTHIAELKEFASYYVGAKLDGIKVTVRNVGIYAALGVVGLIAASAVISTAVVLLLTGLAFAIGALFEPDRPWVGAIVVGLLVLGGLAGGIIFGMKKLTNTFRKQLVQKYENRQRDQRINFGEDVRGRREGPSGRPS